MNNRFPLIRSQSGNVLFIILIAVALFAALSYAVSNMMRGGTTIGSEKSLLLATEVINYARSVKDAVDLVRITNGCEDTQISFERSPFDGSDPQFVNVNSPSDFSCHVFHPEGGGSSYVGPSPDVSSINYFFLNTFAVSDVGDNSNPEIVMFLGRIPEEVCNAINTQLGISTTPTEETPTTLAYVGWSAGVFLLGEAIGSKIGTGSTEFDGKYAGCYFNTNLVPNTYVFYQVLLAR
ncbi:MAG: hypothetical protein GC137_06450 [Alphaproteobacteria bacterium]|nr:hypothetical protein [Alphaproteobacteria bacterium]